MRFGVKASGLKAGYKREKPLTGARCPRGVSCVECDPHLTPLQSTSYHAAPATGPDPLRGRALPHSAPRPHSKREGLASTELSPSFVRKRTKANTARVPQTSKKTEDDKSFDEPPGNYKNMLQGPFYEVGSRGRPPLCWSDGRRPGSTPCFGCARNSSATCPMVRHRTFPCVTAEATS